MPYKQERTHDRQYMPLAVASTSVGLDFLWLVSEELNNGKHHIATRMNGDGKIKCKLYI